MSRVAVLESVEPGTPVIFGGNRVLRVPEDIAARFAPGDALVAVEATEELLHIPAAARRVAEAAVTRALGAFGALQNVADANIAEFYRAFADRLADDAVWRAIREENDADVEDATRRGRSTTRLVASDKLRASMIEGLRGWITTESKRGRVLETVEHERFRVELVGAALGVVGFVFEGRPNVVADATGVLRGGNTVVFRIGRDALRTARAILANALDPALAAAGLPEGAVSLVESAEHAAGWALFSDPRLALAVARGSGPAVATLGALARQAGVAVSLHGTGGAWIVAHETVAPDALREAVVRSLDRKVCNTLNTCCIPAARARDLVPAFLAGLEAAASRLGQSFKLHVVEGHEAAVPKDLFEKTVSVRRAEGDVQEKQADVIGESELGREWEWEQSPEVSLTLVRDVDHAIALFNRHSPQFVASLVGGGAAEHDRFFERVNAPFVGDGFTRWVDGQFALRRPELGLSNWQHGRLFGRGGILSGDTVFTVRTRYRTI